jgi:hypothetical protein
MIFDMVNDSIRKALSRENDNFQNISGEEKQVPSPFRKKFLHRKSKPSFHAQYLVISQCI